MKRMLLVAMVTALLVPASAGASAGGASYCSLGDNGITYNRLGEPAQFKSLSPFRGMNCASARYVLNKWLRRDYARSRSHRLPTNFYDGYVTWYCHKRTRLRWQCDEYDSYTTFRFIAYRY